MRTATERPRRTVAVVSVPAAAAVSEVTIRTGERIAARSLLGVMLIGLLASLAACGNGPQAVGVELREWSVIPERTSVPEGEVTFNVENVGEVEHEFMVVRTDLDLTRLPTEEDGSLDVDDDGVELVDPATGGGHLGHHTVVEPGDEASYSYDLEDGSYVLVCNLVDEPEDDAEEDEGNVHFDLGMRIPFEVE